MTHWPPGSDSPEREDGEAALPEVPKTAPATVFEPADVTYLMAVKPFLSARAQTIVELLVNLFGRPGETLNPASLLSIMTAMTPSARADGQTAAPGSGAGAINPLMALLSLINSQNGGKK